MEPEYIVLIDPDAVIDFEAVTGRGERKAVLTAIDKLRMLGPALVTPHMKSLKGESGLYELRPRQGRSPTRPIYMRKGAEYLVLAMAVKPDKADFDGAVKNARDRAKRYS